MTNPSLQQRRRRKATILALLAAGALGAGVFASFTDTETVTRNVDAGKLDIVVGPEEFTVAEMAPGDIFSRGMVIDIPDATNEGDLIELIGIDIRASDGNTCADVNTVCANPTASLVDGDALDVVIISCPSGGLIYDANPTVDDDSDPTTNSRYDGVGPYECKTAIGAPQQFTWTWESDIVHADVNMPPPPGGGIVGTLWPISFGADEVNIGDQGHWGVGAGDTITFKDGQTIEMVACISMPNEITDDDIDGNDNDYENLSAVVNFKWDAYQRYGAVLPHPATVSPAPNSPSMFDGCRAAVDNYYGYSGPIGPDPGQF